MSRLEENLEKNIILRRLSLMQHDQNQSGKRIVGRIHERFENIQKKKKHSRSKWILLKNDLIL